MESNSIINSREEVDQLDQEYNNDAGTGRSYECVFCKRGFTTAQALGGHMNIHRKDRARNRPISGNSNRCEEIYNAPLIYQPILNYTPRYLAADHQAQINYRTYFPASTSNSTPLYENPNNYYSHDHNPQILAWGEDCGMSLSLKFGAAHAEEIEKKRHGGIAEDELDLELRLGHKQ